jgi:glycosyltransferase involved in cell wall biosynthesis
MASRTVDVVAPAGPSADPYAPGTTAWALAIALARAGDHVQVLFPTSRDSAPPPSEVTAIPLELPLRHPGAPSEGAELASAAGRRIRPTADLIVRDPVGLGPLGLKRAARRGPLVVGFVRGLELATYDQLRTGNSVGFRDRLDRWRDRRSVRRLEEGALQEADQLFADDRDVAKLLTEHYAVPAARVRATLPPVPPLPSAPPTDEARGNFRIPTDVPVVAAPAPFESPEASGTDRAREAFRRVRSFFPGARLLITGTTAPTEAHVSSTPDRDGATLARALAAADVAVFDRRIAGFDPGAVLALRAGRSVIVGPGVRFSADPGDAVRTLTSDDPGEFASVLAELLADPASRRPMAKAGSAFARRFEPQRVAEELVEATQPLAA